MTEYNLHTINDQATALVIDLAKHVIGYMRTALPSWQEVYVRIDTPSDSQRGARVSYIDASGITIIDVMEHRDLIAGILPIAQQLRDALANNGRKFRVCLFRANAKLDYHIDFEWSDANKWAMTKLCGATGLPVVNDRRYGAKPGSAYWRHLRIGVKEPVNDRRNGATSGSP